MTHSLKEDAIQFHLAAPSGKIEVRPTKRLETPYDLSLAYSPGVAYACEAIQEDPLQAARLTSRGNLVAVVTNGTAVLGLGAIGPLAGKPVMEGKGVLFKKFANIDVFDIEINETDPDRFIQIVKSLEPTFGGINLEDIKAPECFEIEKRLKSEMQIPVFHDDQHGTAIIAAAALLNALELQKKSIEAISVVASGAGAAGMACLDLFVSLGVAKENIIVCDSRGPIYEGRPGSLSGRKGEFVSKTAARSLSEAMAGADVFLGVSKGGLLTPEMVARMAERPIIFALANPDPEICPEEVAKVRSDAIVATGRSDYPNQVNNVLCFPYLFRGALDVGATEINEAMKLAAVTTLAELAKTPPNEISMGGYTTKEQVFGPEYLIPKPFDPRLITRLPLAVAKAAMESGVASRPISDWVTYRYQLEAIHDKTSMAMRSMFEQAVENPLKVVFAEGEDLRVLRAVAESIGRGICRPVLIGREESLRRKIEMNHLAIDLDKDVEWIDPNHNPYYEACWEGYLKRCGRIGINPTAAKQHMLHRHTALGAMLIELGYADTMVCGSVGRFHRHVYRVEKVLGVAPSDWEQPVVSTMEMVLTPSRTLFLADTQVNENPTAEEIAQIALLTARAVERLGEVPRLALLSHSDFGSRTTGESAKKMTRALELIREKRPSLIIDGEMQADTALDRWVRESQLPSSVLDEDANVLIFPSLDSASIAFTMLKALSKAAVVGPIVLGMKQPVSILSNTATTHDVVNMTAIAVAKTTLHRLGRD